MNFPPIAIVGQACLLPGASSPHALWDAVVSGRDLLGPLPSARWRMDADLALAIDPAATVDRLLSDRAGFITDFVFSPDELSLPADVLAPLDPLCHWLLHVGRDALRDARPGRDERAGAVFGNLSFPSEGLSRFAESVWLAQNGLPAPRRAVTELNRFMSGLPGHILAAALDLEAGVLALDAACASSLYAMQIACAWLATGRADLMLAGGVNRADMLFIQMGFSALGALSPTGRSRPFHREADGLVPAEGAALIALRRLDDAVRRQDRILGIIRGIGLSNDGRSEGVLIPSSNGQVRAMQLAYEVSGLAPSDVTLVECHAPGTHVGDAIEVGSLNRVFAGCEDIAIGSIKSNLGHLITAAGAAGVIKVLGAMRAETLPPTLHVEKPLAGIDGSPLRLVTHAEPWTASRPRRAAVSGFGFGGNNSHVIIEEWQAGRSLFPSGAPPRPTPCDLAIVGIGAVVAAGANVHDFTRALVDGTSYLRPQPDGSLRAATAEVTLPLAGLRFPPRDLHETLPQQLVVLQAALEAVASVPELPGPRTGVVIGMQADAEIARYGMRWRLPTWCREWRKDGLGTPDEPWVESALRHIIGPLQSAGVVGTMPNIPANRINRQLDLGGPSYTVSAEELSGIRALEIAAHALQEGNLDVAIVGAVDLCCEAVQIAALPDVPPGDAAVVLVIKRLTDARAAGDRVYAVLPSGDPGGDTTVSLQVGPRGMRSSLTAQFGHAHACSGLLHVTAAALACYHRIQPAPARAAAPWLPASDGRLAEVHVSALGGQSGGLVLLADPTSQPALPAGLSQPRLFVYSGADRHAVGQSLKMRREGNDGPARLVLVVEDDAHVQALHDAARDALDRGTALPSGVYFQERPVGGDLSFVFSGPAGAYHGMGRDLLLAMPELADALLPMLSRQRAAAGWLYRPDSMPTPSDKLWGSSFLAQIHAQLTRGVWKLAPAATIGFSSGETNALFAMGAWSDMDAFHQAIIDAGAFTREISGSYATVQRAWGEPGPIRWASWHVLASEGTLRELLEAEPHVHLAIINAPGNFVISGDADGCTRVLARLGAHRARPLNYDLSAHCPETAAYQDGWRRLHHRATSPVPGVRFYTHATFDSYAPTADGAADALLGQFSRSVDFPRLIEKAWQDGVRIFLEHGPLGSCCRWIDQILGEREHLAIPLDVAERSSWRQAWHALGQLAAAGVSVPLTGWSRPHAAMPVVSGAILRLPAHLPELRLPALTQSPSTALPAAPKRPTSEWAPSPRAAAPAGAQRMSPPPSRHRGGTAAVAEAIAPDLPAHAESNAEVVLDAAIAGTYAQFLQTVELCGHVHQQYLASAHDAYRSVLAFCGGPAAAGASLADVGLADSIARKLLPPIAAPPTNSRDAIASPAPARPGPKFSRTDLEWLASGEISARFGPLFRRQDEYVRQVRMPEPPLLLTDRVTGIKGEPGVLGQGTIWTETDVAEDSWYLHDGHMPAGIMIEAGQSDLLLISWMGIDFLNKGERVYRLLGCELTYHGGLPSPGETLQYDIHVDGHAQQGDVRLFFFHSDCRSGATVRLAVRNGQAGFFTDEELAGSMGVLWDPATVELPPGHVDALLVAGTRVRFTADEVRAFSEGRAYECFGPGYELAQTHTRTPRIQSGRMRFLDEVTHLDPAGGPWRRGYLRAVQHLHPDDWFLPGHFKNDPCMPGTLMFEGCLQAMAFYLTSTGATLDRDGFRFEPVPDETFKLRCRGQATPTSRQVIYEVFVRELTLDPIPMLRADLLCTVDGMKAFHCEGMALHLVPDWPLSSQPELLRRVLTGRPAAEVDGFRFDERAMLSCAWGRPADAFGPRFAVFDGIRRTGHLPGPPYFFMTRITHLDAVMGDIRNGSSVIVEWDIPPDAFYFVDNPAGTMPFAVLMEAALQPCGWLATFLGITLKEDQTLYFRNLDGKSLPAVALTPRSGTMRTHVTCTNISASGGITIQSYRVECFLGDDSVFKMDTVFGHFPKAALATQVGLPRTAAETAWLDEPNDMLVDLRQTAVPGLPVDRLLMIDRVDGYWPGAGAAGLGRMRAVKEIDAGQWFFKAHFFQDPVQPGSLGVQGMIQLLQFYAIHTGLAEGMARPVFEDTAVGRPAVWKYRGQVRPQNKKVIIELEACAVEREADAIVITANTWLWVDGICIYHGDHMAVRLKDAGTEPPERRAGASPIEETTLDAATDPWVLDHCPTYVPELPALPAMWILDRLAQAATAHDADRHVTAIRDVRIRGWLSLARPLRLRTHVDRAPDGSLAVRLEAWRQDWELAATARVTLDARYAPAPAPVAELADAQPADSPYENGRLFHGPAFRLMRDSTTGRGGASSHLDAGGGAGAVPRGLCHPALLDAALHAIPHDNLNEWDTNLPADHAAYPYLIESATFHGPTPVDGDVRCEVRLVAGSPFPTFQIQLFVNRTVWAELRVLEVLMPKGRLGQWPGAARVRFLRERGAVTGMALSRFDDGRTRLADEEVSASDWLPGTVAAVYGTADPREIVARDHVASRGDEHPSRVQIDDRGSATLACLPLTRFHVSVRRERDEWVAEDAADEELILQPVRAFWEQRLGLPGWVLTDLYLGLAARFVRRVRLVDSAALHELHGRPVLYVANHQVQVESLLFSILMGAVSGNPISTVARIEHRPKPGDTELRTDQYWLGPLVAHTMSYPGFKSWHPIVFFDQADPASLLRTLDEHRRQAAPHSLFVHVQGTRARSSRERITQVSAAFLDLALALDAPIVPVWFAGGLPAATVDERLDFPSAYGAQDYIVGRPILPDAIRRLPYAARRDGVMRAVNELAPPEETVRPGETALVAEQARLERRGLTPVQAVMLATLTRVSTPSEETEQVLRAAAGERQERTRAARGRWLETLVRWLGGQHGFHE